MDYKQAGVDYSRIDPLKILAQQAARATVGQLTNTGWKEMPESRGESAYVMDCGDFYLASITECLGTKPIVADALRTVTGKTYYDTLAQDTIAMAVNDLITVGARPVSIHAYWAAGGSDWFNDKQRAADLVAGWKAACEASCAVWAGGETPSLNGIVMPGRIDLAASCVGMISPRERYTLGDKLQAGDAIILLASSGIHANGLTLARALADRLSDGYATLMPSGQMYGEGLLAPTVLYAQVLEALFTAGIDIHYLANITGHGWRKIMRHSAKFSYHLTSLPDVPEVLQFMVDQGPIDLREAYGSLNMGAGFAVFVPAAQAAEAVTLAARQGITAWEAGTVREGDKQVVIEPLEIVYEGSSLAVRSE